MVFKPSQKRPYGNIQIIEVSIDNQHIVRVKKTRLFFVILDGNLN